MRSRSHLSLDGQLSVVVAFGDLSRGLVPPGLNEVTRVPRLHPDALQKIAAYNR